MAMGRSGHRALKIGWNSINRCYLTCFYNKFQLNLAIIKFNGYHDTIKIHKIYKFSQNEPEHL